MNDHCTVSYDRVIIEICFYSFVGGYNNLTLIEASLCACLIMVAVVSLCTRCCNKKCHNEYEDEVVWAETRIMNNTYSSNRKCNESTNGNSDNSPLAKDNTCERNVSQTSTLDILPYNDDRTIITPITKDNSLNVRESTQTPDIPHVTKCKFTSKSLLSAAS